MVVYNIKNGSASVFTNFLWARITIIGFFNSMNTFIEFEKAFAYSLFYFLLDLFWYLAEVTFFAYT
jgi:hypothetical protein